MNQTIHILKLLLGWPISFLALFFLFKTFSPKTESIFQHIHSINGLFLFFGILCFLFYFFVRALLWQYILKEKEHFLPFKESTFLWEMSEFKRFVPGNIWSLFGRMVSFSQKNVSKKTVFSAMVLENGLFLLSCLIVSIPSLPFVTHRLLLVPSGFQTSAKIFIITLTLIFIFSQPLIRLSKLRIFSFLQSFILLFKPLINLKLLTFSILYIVFFGMGTFFTISSIVSLHPYYLLTFISFFIFSFLAGFLSFITPSGLGVREAVTAYGLSFFIPPSIAAIAAIFARIVLVGTEVLFLGVVALWKYSKSTTVTYIEQFFKKYSREVLLSSFVFLYITYFTFTSFLRFENFYTGRFDLGNMDQTVWNTTQGRIFELTNPNGTEIISRLSFHADYILVLISPLYLIWSDPRMLLLLQTIILASGAFFVYLLAKKILQNKTVALIFSLLYLLNPYIHHTNLYDFHSVTLATTFLLGTFYFLLSNRYIWFLIFLLLSALTKEHIWIITGLIGAFLFLRASHKRKLGLIIFVLSALTFYYLVWHAIPASYGGSHFALEYYSDFGVTPTSIVRNIFLSPLTILQTFLQEERVYYLYQLFLPLGFLPLLSPFTLLFASPDLFINLLSNNKQLYQIYYQYSATITPFLFISAIFGVKTILKFFPQIPHQLVTCYLLFVTCYSAYLFGPLPGAKKPNIDMFVKPAANKDIINKTLAQIPENKKVAATNNLGAHLTHRQYLFTVPVGMKSADIIAFLLGDVHAQPSPQAQEEMVVELKNNPNYKILAELDNFIVFEKIQ